jgi:hypothetical protein
MTMKYAHMGKVEGELLLKLARLSAMKAPRNGRQRMHWVRPELVARVEFLERSSDGHLRHPTFQGCARTCRAVFRRSHALPEAKELARHSDINMTMKYAHIGIVDQAKAVAKLVSAFGVLFKVSSSHSGRLSPESPDSKRAESDERHHRDDLCDNKGRLGLFRSQFV